MSLRCLPSGLGSIPFTVWEQMFFEEFQDGPHGSHFWRRNGTNLAVLNLYVSMSPKCLPPSFSLIRLTVPEQMSFQDFQAGHLHGHLGYWNGTNLALLNLHVTQMPPTKVNPTYSLGADMVWRFSKRPPWGQSWISEQKDFSNSECLCCSDVFHQISAQSNLQFVRRCCLKIFKMADMAAILDIGTEWF